MKKFSSPAWELVSTPPESFNRRRTRVTSKTQKHPITSRQIDYSTCSQSTMCSTLTAIEDVGRASSRVGLPRPRPEGCRLRCRAESWHSGRCRRLSSCSAISNFHRTFPRRYSWLGICPLSLLIIDWFPFGFAQPVFTNDYPQFSSSSAFFFTDTTGRRFSFASINLGFCFDGGHYLLLVLPSFRHSSQLNTNNLFRKHFRCDVNWGLPVRVFLVFIEPCWLRRTRSILLPTWIRHFLPTVGYQSIVRRWELFNANNRTPSDSYRRPSAWTFCHSLIDWYSSQVFSPFLFPLPREFQ